MEYFTTEKISESTTAIRDITGVYCYLVEGQDRAVLIDTATGCGDLKAFVESLTDKPLSVILTHGHCDHAAGAAAFDEVYLNEEDWELVKKHATMDGKKDYVRFVAGEDVFAEIPEDAWCPERTAPYLPLDDRQVFDLGGVTLEMVAVPGHTAGMVCVLNRGERTILFGDACNPSVFLWDEEATSVEKYRDSLLRLKERENEFDRVLISHCAPDVDKKVLDGVIEVCDEILAGKADAIPFRFMDYQGLLLAKAEDENGNRKDGGLGNIVYHSGKIFA